MTWPSADSDLLMLLASRSRSPTAPDDFCRSLPDQAAGHGTLRHRMIYPKGMLHIMPQHVHTCCPQALLQMLNAYLC